MKIRILNLIAAAGLVCTAGSALADYDHVPLKRVEGFVVHSSASVSNLVLDEGQYTGCTVSASGLSVTRCQLDQAKMTLKKSSGETLTVPLSQLSYYKSSAGDQVFHHYVYKGIWKITQNGKTLESDIAIDVIHMGTGTPGAVRGYISMNDLDISEQIKGQAYPY